MSISESKPAIRRATLERILALDPVRRAAEELALQAQFPALPGYATAATVLLYVSAFAEEISTWPLLRLTLERGKRLICPRVDRSGGGLQLFEVRDLMADLRRGTLGIPEPKRTCPRVEPAEIDWVLVPGLTFDARGYRLGRGAGHYDRLLPTLRPDAPRWALALDEQWVEAELPVEPHDVPLDGIASPSRTVDLSRAEVPRRGAERTP